MSDYSIRAPEISHAQREKEGLYQRFLSWMSMSKPGLWRLRIDIMAINYVLMAVAAISAWMIFQPFSGLEERSYCGNDPRGSCVGTVDFYQNNDLYVWTTGYSADDVMWTTIWFAFASFILTVIWAFFVSRGTRLRGLVVQSSFPGFMVALAVLLPMVIFPLLAGLLMFMSTHGGGVETLLTGVTGIVSEQGREYAIAFPGMRHYSPAERWFSQSLLLLLMFGSFSAYVVAISMKIILADGVMGLVKSIVIAGIFAVITVLVGIFVFQGRADENTFIQLGLLLVFGILYYFSFRISLMRNKRSKLSRTIGLSFCMFWIGWFPLVFIFTMIGFDLEGTVNGWLLIAIFTAIYVFFLSFTFRDISRINLLPQP